MVTIIDYGVGNLGSIRNMLKKIGASAEITADLAQIAKAQKIILPGVGAFDSALVALRERGFFDILNKKALQDKVPILGICLGMQLMSLASEEGQLQGFGWVKATTRKFDLDASNSHCKVPHMGWNTVKRASESCPLLRDFDVDPRFYFVHSYHLVCEDRSSVVGLTNYGYDFASVIAHDNLYGAQFHPEKSHKFGMQLLRNFVHYC